MKMILFVTALALLSGCVTESQTANLGCEDYNGNWAGAPKTSCETVVHHWNSYQPPNVVVGKTVVTPPLVYK